MNPWANSWSVVTARTVHHASGIVSGLLQGGYSWGYIISAAVFTTLYPALTPYGDLAWRSMFWLGILPALLVLWIRARVPESPVWLERQQHLRHHRTADGVSLVRIFKADLLGTTVQTSVLMAAFMFSYYSITYWYATFLREAGRSTLPYIVVFNIGAIVGAFACGRMSEGRLGRRGASTVAALASVIVVPAGLLNVGIV